MVRVGFTGHVIQVVVVVVVEEGLDSRVAWEAFSSTEPGTRRSSSRKGGRGRGGWGYRGQPRGWGPGPAGEGSVGPGPVGALFDGSSDVIT